MFSRLGKLVVQHSVFVILAWTALVGGLKLGQWVEYIPRWDDVTRDGDLAHLPAEVSSLRGAELLRRAFPEDQAKSQVVVVVARPTGPLTAADLAMAGRLATAFRDEMGQLPILDVWTYRTEVVGRELRSRDRRAVLIVLQLRNELMATDNIGLLHAVRHQIDTALEDAPSGLRVGITGSAAIGGDMLTAAAESIRNTESFAILLVAIILLVVYRAPLLVAVPLLTIVVSISVGTDIVACLAASAQRFASPGWEFKIFKTTKIFVVVILYGAGTDYCLFLTARYREELARGLPKREAVAHALGQVGSALAASALTTIVGLATMVFAAFGKFSSSGPAIAICLAVTLLACITLAPALLQALGDIVFWPLGRPSAPAGRPSPQPMRQRLLGRFWDVASRAILARPGLILATSLLVLLPLACLGWSVEVTFDLLSELGPDRTSVRGTALLRRHFPPGETGPLTVLAHRPDGGFDTKPGAHEVAQLTRMLYEIEGVTSVRSIAEPLGDAPGSVQLFTKAGLAKLVAKPHPPTQARFVAQSGDLKGRVARFELVLAHDPFSAEAIERLEAVDKELAGLRARDSYWHNVDFEFVGTTAGIRDLKRVTESDRRLIQQLVVITVLMVLLLILRRPLICAYLILSVLLSYLVTIGITELSFKWLYGDPGFEGLDWKVPIFLFVILVAVGEDYNIYLVARVFEEQRRLGPREGLRTAIVKTGGIITSCGVIMAGTFVSMMTGSLRGMLELGFALTLGILLDTFVVRTILVPSFLALTIPRRSG